MPDTTPPTDAVVVEVNGRQIDPNEDYAQDAQNTQHIIISSYDVLVESEKIELQKLNVGILEDLGSNNLLCRYKPTDLEPLRQLSFVRQVDVYRNKLKIPSTLQMLCEMPELAGKLFSIDVMVHQETTNLEILADSIATKLDLDRQKLQVLSNKIRLEVPLSRLGTIAADDRVRVIEEVVTPVLFDDEARRIVVSSMNNIRPRTALRGNGQIVAVYDSGFDTGSTFDCHPAFSGKVIKLVPIGRTPGPKKSEEASVDDVQGHGTHVCGTIVGEDIQTSQGLVGGVAPDAKLVVASLENNDGDLVSIREMTKMFSTPHQTYGACIHSNSWGDGVVSVNDIVVQRLYGDAAGSIDDFVRKNPEALVCFSAGNDNETAGGKQAIGSQAAAKNCLTIGASGSTRTIRSAHGDVVGKINPDEVWPQSSRGPTRERRIKPDVVAPGFNIFSAQTRHPKSLIKESAQTRAKAMSDQYPGTLWTARSGTSHSTPLVSGCAAILREALCNKGFNKPPAALLKALIINGADMLPRISVAEQGFGRVNLDASVAMLAASPLVAEQMTTASHVASLSGTLIGKALKQGEEFSFTLSPPELLSKGPETRDMSLKLTMVYNDLPGGQIQNNLNLAVIDPFTGELRHGGISEDDIDLQNNVEQVVWDSLPSRSLKIRVTAQKIRNLNDSQDYALAWLVTPTADQ